MSKLIRTTIKPSVEIVVSDEEYVDLSRQGLVYGEALPAPPDPDDVEVAGFLDNETSQTYARLLAQLATAVGAGEGVLPDALRAALVPFWAPSEVVASGAVRMTALGVTIKRNTSGTTRASYDATESALWTVTSGGGGGAATTDASALTSGTLDADRIADGSLPVAKMAVDIATQSELDAVANAVPEQARDALGTALVAGAGITKTVDDAGDTITVAAPDVPSLLAAVGFTGTFRGAWAGNIGYAVGDVVTADGGLVRVTTAHTSNAAGFTYDRDKWEAIPIPVLHGASTVRVRHLDLTNAGGTGTPVPAAGVFQRRPKRFNYKAERVLWTAQAAADVTVTSGTVANGSRPLGSALVTCNTSGSTNITFPARAAFDVTGGFFRVPLTLNDPNSRFLTLQVSSDGAWTNYHEGVLLWSNVDAPPSGGKVAMYGVPVTEMSVVGTGANLSAITAARLVSSNAAPALTIDVEQIRWHPNASDKTKVVISFDDGGLTNQVAAMKILAKFGFPFTVYAIANNLTGSGSTFNGDAARHVQNVYGAQIGVHAYGGNDHNVAQQTGQPILEQLLDYQHFQLAMGFTGGDDLAYWNPGLTQGQPLSDEVTIRKLFRSARTTAGRFPETLPPIDPYRTIANNGSTSATMQAFVTKAIAYKGCAQFLWHALSAGNLTELTTFCTWLDGQRANVDVVTAAQAFDPLCV